MPVLVTGGSGFVGSAIVLELLKRGQPVRTLVRSRERLGNLEGLDVEVVEGDLLDCDSLERALRGCEQVFAAAALYANWLPEPTLIERVNIQGTHNLLEMCLHGGQRVVYTSSTAALGAHGHQPANESARFNLEEVGDAYYVSKYRAEQVALDMAAQGLDVVIVNPTNPVGPRDIKPTPTGALILSVLKRALPGYVDGGINLIDVDDVAIGHVLAMEKGKPGERYVLGNANLSIHDYFDLIGEVAGVTPPGIELPKSFARLAAFGYTAVARITNTPPLTTPAWVEIGSRYSFWDSSKAVRELGLPQHSIQESIARAVQWFRERGYA
jgi:dihydroflavonol-4-reductase